jgi:predicted metal-dependent hydrolase
VASKSFTLEQLGKITVYKRRGTRRLNLRIVGGHIKVTQPMWLPYAAGVKFAQNNLSWINTQKEKQPQYHFVNGQAIGKSHTLTITQGTELKAKVVDSKIVVTVPSHYDEDSEQVLETVKKACKKALKSEAEEVLPSRVALLADKYDFTYNSVRCKSMRSRWGSCTSNKDISLNIFLMMVPWELIDYVLVHELTHTKALHHGPDFWGLVAEVMPDYKERKKKLSTLQHLITPLQ